MAQPNAVTRALKKIERNFATAKRNFERALQGKAGQLANRALARIKTEPGAPRYPIQWTSPRQRMAFFASNGFGRGIPTQRSGNLLAGWEVAVHRSQGHSEVTLENLVSYMTFVQGFTVQGFHLDTGYVQMGDVQDEFITEAGENASLIWVSAADPLAGV